MSDYEAETELVGNGMNRTIKCTDCKVDEFIKNNYRPVDDKPGYVWLDHHNFEIIELDTLKKSMCDFCMSGLDKGTVVDALCYLFGGK